MDDDLKGTRARREQTALVMKLAAKSLGSLEKLAECLGVELHLLAEWIARKSDAPHEIVNKAVGAIGALNKSNRPRH